jgi:hypothetical protein
MNSICKQAEQLQMLHGNVGEVFVIASGGTSNHFSKFILHTTTFLKGRCLCTISEEQYVQYFLAQRFWEACSPQV